MHKQLKIQTVNFTLDAVQAALMFFDGVACPSEIANGGPPGRRVTRKKALVVFIPETEYPNINLRLQPQSAVVLPVGGRGHPCGDVASGEDDTIMPYTLLVVDDDTDILTALRGNLALDGHQVITAETGKKALQHFQEQSVDLVLLDLQLPDMDGVLVCRHIRSRSSVPIIVVSAREGTADKVLLFENGADDYVVKPYDYLELAARIKVRMRRDRSFAVLASDDRIQVGPLTLRPKTRRVEIDGRKAELTHKEYQLLTFLCQRAGRVIDRKTIRLALWSAGRIYQWSRAIDVHVQHIRAKLENDPSDPQLIRTVPGVGYLLSLDG